ncbi:MAG: methyltransferase domain-containing protein [Cyclobacteriaceae bacterium]|nr:methyltransferase domain-containing protein [Cyclobacteriaceae bacterium]
MKKSGSEWNNKDFYPDFFSLFYHTAYFSRLRLVQFIKKYSHELDGRLLDFGSGAKPYRKLFQVTEYIGVDIEKSGHHHGDSMVDVYYDGKNIPFNADYFDSCFSSEVFEHVFNLPEIIRELNRVIKPHGKLLITIPFAIHEHETPYDYARYTSFGITDLLEKNGFEVIRVDKTNNYIEALFQLMVWYVASLLYKGFKPLTFLQLLFFVAPLNIAGLVLSKLLPKRYSYFSNLVVLAKKV